MYYTNRLCEPLTWPVTLWAVLATAQFGIDKPIRCPSGPYESIQCVVHWIASVRCMCVRNWISKRNKWEITRNTKWLPSTKLAVHTSSWRNTCDLFMVHELTCGYLHLEVNNSEKLFSGQFRCHMSQFRDAYMLHQTQMCSIRRYQANWHTQTLLFEWLISIPRW